MRVNADLYVLPLPLPRSGPPFPLNVCLIIDADGGPTLVDTGLPGQLGEIAAALAEAGLAVGDLRRIILTHQDYDHIGSLHDLVAVSGAEVLAHSVEAPAIDGRALPRFATPEALASRPELGAAAEAFRPTPIDRELQDGDRLDLAGGVRVVFTPGHTPGHSSLYLERSKALISGDALTAADGRLQGPNPAATEDMALAAASIRRLAELDVTTIVCYHGGIVDDDAGGQLRRVAEEMAAEG
jgi:glyoxylase-like metal-dependent hydrolase (beta-lactamase superfamily II)